MMEGETVSDGTVLVTIVVWPKDLDVIEFDDPKEQRLPLNVPVYIRSRTREEGLNCGAEFQCARKFRFTMKFEEILQSIKEQLVERYASSGITEDLLNSVNPSVSKSIDPMTEDFTEVKLDDAIGQYNTDDKLRVMIIWTDCFDAAVDNGLLCGCRCVS